ncbi:tetratricopeptide repeat protein [Brevundimonas sp.]
MRAIPIAIILALSLVLARPAAAQDFDTLLARLEQGQAMAREGRWVEAESWYRQTLPMAQAVSGEGSADEAVVYILIANSLRDQGRTVEAEALYRDVLTHLDTILERPSLTHSVGLNGLGMLLMEQWRMQEALEATRTAAEMRAELEGESSEGSLVFATDQALVLKTMGRHAEADVLYRRILAVREATQPGTTRELATVLNNMGTNLLLMDRADEAEPYLRRAIAIQEANEGLGHPSTAVTLSVLGTVMTAQGKLDVAEAMLRRAIAIMPPADTSHLEGAYSGLTSVLVLQGRLDEAVAISESGLLRARERTADDTPELGALLFELGKIRLAQSRPEQALPLFTDAVRIFQTTLPDRQSIHIRPLTLLAQSEELTGRRQDAELHLRQAVQVAETGLPEGHFGRILAVSSLGTALQGWGRPDEAMPLLRQGGQSLISRTSRRGSNDTEARRDLDDLRLIFRLTVQSAWTLAQP